MAREPEQKPDSGADPIGSALALLLGGGSEKKTLPASAPEQGGSPMPSKGRRYSPSEKKAILGDDSSGVSLEDLKTKYGVCRETIARWKLRTKKQGKPAGVEAAPTGSDSKEAVSSAQDTHIGYHPHWREALKVWRSRPGLGPAQISGQLRRAGIKITVATTRKILEENGYTPPKASAKEVEINSYEAVRPLELVHMDFKHFWINRSKAYLLLLQDDFSRFICGHRMTDSENMKTVIEVFEQCVGRYGKMQSLMTDAGSAFYSWNGINKFQRLLSEEYGIDQIKARTPRSNGKLENVNKQIEKEVLDVKRYSSLQEASDAIEAWTLFYNFERTHMGLPKGMVPADRFLFGWNQRQDAGPRKQAWTEVLRLALGEIKRAA
jgi:transposase InsO family protein